jgi:hypothetical protein
MDRHAMTNAILDTADRLFHGSHTVKMGFMPDGTPFWTIADSSGVVCGTRFKSEEALKKAMDGHRDRGRLAFKIALDRMDDDRFLTQYGFWVKNRPQGVPVTPPSSK